MLNLPTPTDETLESYYNLIKERIEVALNVSTLDVNAKSFLSQNVKKILISKPSELVNFHDALIPLLFIGSSIPVYNNYVKAKSKPKKQRSQADTALIGSYKVHIEEIKKVFDYNTFISGHKITSYWLANVLNRNTCTYCNRLYTITIDKKDKKTKRHNDKNRITRPEFDHWYSKSKYPILALSFHNLIPSCSVCNSSIKGASEFELTTHNHPYIDKTHCDFEFSFRLRNVHESNVKINVKSGSKAETTLNEFKIFEVYNGHSNLELRDLLELKFNYPEDHLETLFSETFKGFNIKPEEAYRLVFGVEYEEDKFHKRPFSKFKKDIISELRKIDRESK